MGNTGVDRGSGDLMFLFSFVTYFEQLFAFLCAFVSPPILASTSSFGL